MVNKYAYDEFGNVLNSQEAVTNPFKYVGQFGVMDEGNGLLHMRARYYDTGVGRFISKDPIGYWGGINPYAYVANNPINFSDPSGLSRPTIPGYWRYMRWLAPRVFCNMLKQRIEHAEEVNKDCRELNEPEAYYIDPEAYTFLAWCYTLGYLK
jgi:RHS repeat-associated protein